MSENPILDPRYRYIYEALQQQSKEIKRLNDILAPDVFDMSIFPIDKASTFTNTKVSTEGARLIQISTDGDLSDISYKIPGHPYSMEAAESPHIPGPLSHIFVTNDTAEADKTVRVARYKCSDAMAAAIMHGTPLSVALEGGERGFYAAKEDFDGTLNYFETDQAITDTPTLYMTGSPLATFIKIHSIKYQMTPTNAVTYELYLIEAAAADNEEAESNIIFDSGAAQASGTVYNEIAGAGTPKLPTIAKLADLARIYYLLNWSGAPGDTTGYIKVYGEVMLG